jgi:hypothetical protein
MSATGKTDGATTVIRPRVAPPTPPEGPEEPRTPHRRLLWALVAAIVVALLAVAALWLSRDPSPAPQPTPTATATASPTPTPTITPAEEVEGAVALHWGLIRQGEYADAYDALSPRLRAQVPRAAWIEAQERDRLSEVSVEVRAELGPSPTTARAVVTALRTQANSGCFDWTGAYLLERVGDVWRIAGSKLTRRPC